MKPNFTKKITTLLFAAISLMLFNACQKELSGTLPINADPLPDLTSRVATTVYGFVTDENNSPVVGAVVKAGSSTVNTDSRGYFAFSNIQLVKNAAVVSVSKAGYFKGIKTYIATAGKASFFRIKLIPKTTAGIFTASAGGNVSLSNGMQISFPANAIVNASNNSIYTGSVTVAASWINPTSTDLPTIMPGDLRGIDQDGYLKVLTTYGMIAVEMTGSSGELLQIAAGSKATITFPIPASLSSTAPGSIPLWYFDEQLGLWKEDGIAIKNGSNYVGEVSHFSFWNCDVPANYVQFSCTIVDPAGQAIPHVVVKISVVGSPNRVGFGWTDSTGYTGGAIPNNSQLLLEVFSDYNCGTPAYSQNFSTTNSNVALGNITINNTTYTAHISGTVTDCSSMPVTNGFVIMKIDQRFFRYPVSSTGSFDFNLLMCNTSASALILAEDMTNGQQSTGSNFTITAGNNAIGNIQACGTSISQFMNLIINGVNYSYTMPIDTLYQYGQQLPPSSSINIFANNRNSGSTNGNYSYLYFDNTTIGAGSIQSLSNFTTSYISDSLYFTPPIQVNITEYGAISSGFIAGNFTGIFLGMGPTPPTYNIQCSFRVRRSY